eukprot:12283262-Alexandrium_andersonii.AAC.1
MSASLVGSEMCIRDRNEQRPAVAPPGLPLTNFSAERPQCSVRVQPSLTIGSLRAARQSRRSAPA